MAGAAKVLPPARTRNHLHMIGFLLHRKAEGRKILPEDSRGVRRLSRTRTSRPGSRHDVGPASALPLSSYENETRSVQKHVEPNATTSAILFTGRSGRTEDFGSSEDTPEALVHEVGRRGWGRAARNSSWGPTTSVPLPIFRSSCDRSLLSTLRRTSLPSREIRFHLLEVGRRP